MSWLMNRLSLRRDVLIPCSVTGISFFFFQAEDGIRDLIVTGVQTCALPIFAHSLVRKVCAECGGTGPNKKRDGKRGNYGLGSVVHGWPPTTTFNPPLNHRSQNRSEERRVGKECRSRWSPYH